MLQVFQTRATVLATTRTVSAGACEVPAHELLAALTDDPGAPYEDLPVPPSAAADTAPQDALVSA